MSAPAAAQAGCDRATLQDIADRYEKAQAKGTLFELPVGEWVDYRENLVMSSSATGVLGRPMAFAWTVQLLDTQQCKAFVEGAILEPEQHVLASVVSNGFFGVNDVSVVLGSGSPSELIERASGEQWGELPAERRADRSQLLAVANAHLDGLAEPVVERKFVVDEAKGAVGVFARVGAADGPAVSYTLRIEDGAVRYVHESRSQA